MKTQQLLLFCLNNVLSGSLSHFQEIPRSAIGQFIAGSKEQSRPMSRACFLSDVLGLGHEFESPKYLLKTFSSCFVGLYNQYWVK